MISTFKYMYIYIYIYIYILSVITTVAVVGAMRYIIWNLSLFASFVFVFLSWTKTLLMKHYRAASCIQSAHIQLTERVSLRHQYFVRSCEFLYIFIFPEWGHLYFIICVTFQIFYNQTRFGSVTDYARRYKSTPGPYFLVFHLVSIGIIYTLIDSPNMFPFYP